MIGTCNRKFLVDFSGKVYLPHLISKEGNHEVVCIDPNKGVIVWRLVVSLEQKEQYECMAKLVGDYLTLMIRGINEEYDSLVIIDIHQRKVVLEKRLGAVKKRLTDQREIKGKVMSVTSEKSNHCSLF